MMTDNCGIVFGATGAFYRNLARRAARNLRAAMPDVAIDLYTDAHIEDPVFDQIHLLSGPTRRPKMEALERARFHRAIWLDCDAVVLNDLSDVFAVLERFDIVGAHEQFGSAPVSMQVLDYEIPHAFRQINSGVLGVRRTPEVLNFLRLWREEFEDRNLQYDQPLLRRLLWESDLRVFILPMEYNQMFPPFIRVSTNRMMAPRVLHVTQLHEVESHAELPDQPFNPAELVTPQVRDRINDLMISDRTLGAGRDTRALMGDMLRQAPWLYRLVRRLRRFMN